MSKLTTILLCLLVVLLTFQLSGFSKVNSTFIQNINHRYQCSDKTFQATKIGTAFPINEYLVLTAAHMYCEEGTESYYYQNNNWIKITPIKWNEEYDIMMLHSSEKLTGPFAKIEKNAVLRGDSVLLFGFGIPQFTFDGVMTEGIVSAMSPRFLIFDATIYPGMSGSAILNKNNKVVGMVQGYLTNQESPGLILNLALPNDIIMWFIGR